MNVLTEQQEWEELLAQIPLDIPTRDAANRLGELLTDAIQAHRPWARQRLNEAIHSGLSKTWRSHVQKQRPKLKTKNGTVKQVGGVKRRDGATVVHLQIPFDHMSFQELADHQAMEIANLKALAENTKAIDRLLKLKEQCPKANTPAEACRKLGLDPADVMAGAA